MEQDQGNVAAEPAAVSTDKESPSTGPPAATTRKKKFFLAFVIFFSIFACIGYLQGRSLRNEPDRLRLDVLPRLALRQKQGRDFLVYQCTDNRDVSWDIDGDRRSSERVSSDDHEAHSLTPAVLKNDSMMMAFLTGGGAASVFTVKEMLAYATASGKAGLITNEEHVKLIGVAILAAVSGYEIGYQIALHTNADCSDERFTPILNDAKNWSGEGKWEGFERVYWINLLNEVKKQEHLGACNSSDPKVKDTEEKKFALARARYLALMDTDVLQLEHDLSSADFETLSTYGQVVQEFNQSCAH